MRTQHRGGSMLARLEENVGCVAFCPSEPFQRNLAVGTYELDEATGGRHGGVHIYELHGQASSPMRLELRSRKRTAGVFDLRWLPSHFWDAAACPLLATACSDGCLSLHRLVDSTLDTLSRHQCFKSPTLATCACLHESASSTNTQVFGLSGSDGRLTLIQAREASVETTSGWQAHDLEAWACNFQGSILHSGSDDCTLKGWDLRQPPDTPIFVNRREHKAGVCCLISSPFDEHTFLSGSYDEKVRAWDARCPDRPLCTAQVGTGGGNWRLDWHPTENRLVLASCMQNGFAVLALDNSQNLSVHYEYPHQKSLGYSASWCREASTDRTSIVASGAFYDRSIHVWAAPFDVVTDATADVGPT